MFSVDFPVADENGTLQFQYNKYQISHLTFSENIDSDIEDDIPVELAEIQSGE